MCLTSFVGLRAFGGGDPQVARSSVKDYKEVLCGSSNGDGTIVLGILEVSQGDSGGSGRVLSSKLSTQGVLALSSLSRRVAQRDLVEGLGA